MAVTIHRSWVVPADATEGPRFVCFVPHSHHATEREAVAAAAALNRPRATAHHRSKQHPDDFAWVFSTTQRYATDREFHVGAPPIAAFEQAYGPEVRVLI